MSKEMVVSFLLACALVAGAVWLAFNSDHPTQQNAVPTAVTNAHPSPAMSALETAPSADMKLNAIEQDTKSTHSGVIKCTMNGKTIYSDENCPAGAKAQQVQLHDTAGIISPQKEALSTLTARRHAADNTQVRSMQQPVTMSAQPKQAECDSLNKHIELLDSMARQPQSGQTQDWITQERRKTRDRQFAIRC